MAAPKKINADAPAGAEVIYRDSCYTSRVLILPDDRVLTVTKQHVSVDTGDTTALEYLGQHADFKRQE